MTPATPSTRTRKIRRRGRHKAPSPVRKVAKRAGVAAPAVAVAGALAAAPHLHSLTTSAPKVTGSATAHLVYPAQAANAASALPASQSRAEYRARHARQAHAQAPAAPQRRARLALRPALAPRPRRDRASRPPRPPPAPGACPARRRPAGRCPPTTRRSWSFLTSHGYTGNAAAGIAGNIYQESGGNPESEGDGGGGLIGWTPLPGGYVTGNPAADLQTQLAAILTFNQIWAQYIPALNAASSPAAAADIYVTDFERAGIPAAGTREAAAEAVAAACGI